MDLKKLLSTTPETLAREQYDALTAAVVSRLGKLAGRVQRGELEEASAVLFNSPAGDGHGCENACIDFSEMLERCGVDGCTTDIGDVLGKLHDLKRVLDPSYAKSVGRKK